MLASSGGRSISSNIITSTSSSQRRRQQALTLYKSILRAHERYLPSESMRQLGDAYVKSEFRLHKTAKQEQANLFFVEWEKYLQHIERTGREKQSIEIGLVDPPPLTSSSTPPLPMISMQQNTILSKQSHGNTDTDGGERRRAAVYFGKDISTDIVFNEEQVGKLEQLRDEATKAATDTSMNATNGDDDGNGGVGR